jgi:hypothetical protein
MTIGALTLLRPYAMGTLGTDFEEATFTISFFFDHPSAVTVLQIRNMEVFEKTSCRTVGQVSASR